MEILKHNKTAVVLGATGLIGRHLLEFLLMNRAYKSVVALVRKKLPLSHDNLVQYVIDFDNLTAARSLFKGDDLFISLGTTMKIAGSRNEFKKVDFDYTFSAAKLGLEMGMNQLLVVSSVGADANSMFFYSRVKGELEDAIQKLPYWAVHIFRPSVLLGERNENRWGEEIAGKIGNFFDRLSGGMLTKYKPIEADVVAKSMVIAAQGVNPGVHIYPSYYLQRLSEKTNRELRKF